MTGDTPRPRRPSGAPSGSSCSRTAAARAGTARATVSQVAAALNAAGYATLLIDLLTPPRNASGPTSSTSDVRAPTLLIVGGHDDVVIGLNRRALSQLRCPAELEIVPGATQLFEEPGTLEAVQQLAADWFARHLARTPASCGSR